MLSALVVFVVFLIYSLHLKGAHCMLQRAGCEALHTLTVAADLLVWYTALQVGAPMHLAPEHYLDSGQCTLNLKVTHIKN